MVVEVGDTVTLRDWNGEWIEVRVQKLGTSRDGGFTIEGMLAGGGGFRALPHEHLIEKAKAKNIRHGKWELMLPDETIVHVKSLKAAKEFCSDHGFVFEEVDW